MVENHDCENPSQKGPQNHPILKCPSCGYESSISKDVALKIIIDKLKSNDIDKFKNYSAYAMNNELIRHLELYLGDISDA